MPVYRIPENGSKADVIYTFANTGTGDIYVFAYTDPLPIYIQGDYTDTASFLGAASKVVFCCDFVKILAGQSVPLIDFAYQAPNDPGETPLDSGTVTYAPPLLWMTETDSIFGPLVPTLPIDLSGGFDITVYDIPIPEPNTWTMILVGFLGVGALVRGRRRLSHVVH